jgi:hypothetical protein
MSGESKRLTVHNASVTTMTVEVKTLTIGARQVTQGIFRQLIEERLIAEDGTLNGTPWGHVTWHPGNCPTEPHRHVVWQRGEELRRSTVTREIRFGYFDADMADAYLDVLVSEAAHGRTSPDPLSIGVDHLGVRDSVHIRTPETEATGIIGRGFASAEARSVAVIRTQIVAAERSVTKPIMRYELGQTTDPWAQVPGLRPAAEIEADVKNLLGTACEAGCEISTTADLRELNVSGPVGTDDIIRRVQAREGQVLAVVRKLRAVAAERLADHRRDIVEPLGALDARIASDGRTAGEIGAAFADAIRAEATRRARYRESVAVVWELPQLFIGG